MSSDGHIRPIRVGDPSVSKSLSRVLLHKCGLCVQPVNSPTVPEGTERLRLTPTALQTQEDAQYVINSIESAWNEVVNSK